MYRTTDDVQDHIGCTGPQKMHKTMRMYRTTEDVQDHRECTGPHMFGNKTIMLLVKMIE